MENTVNNGSLLSGLLLPFFEKLETGGLRYCVCGNYEGLPGHTSHDVDVWAEDPAGVERALLDAASENGYRLYLRNGTASGANLFFFRPGAALPPEPVRIDVLRECSWMSFVPLVSGPDIAAHRKRFRGFMVADPQVEAAMHLLYPLVSLRRVKEKYREKIYSMKGDPAFVSLIERALGKRAAAGVLEKVAARDWDGLVKGAGKLRALLLVRLALNAGRGRLGIMLRFVSTNVARILRPAGLFIAFIGPDGSGKTTAIERLGPFFSRSFMSGRSRSYYWRPYMLPKIRELVPFLHRKAEDPTPEQRLTTVGPGLLRAPFYYAKFLYYVFDFVAGRLKYLPVLSRGGVVCFDRYYHDQFVLPQRFGFYVPERFMRLVGCVVPVPDLVFYLSCGRDEILSRKREFSPGELDRQLARYEDEMSRLPQGRVIDGALPADEVAGRIAAACLDEMANRQKGGPGRG